MTVVSRGSTPYGSSSFASEAQEFERGYAVAREITVQSGRSRVARPSGVAQQQPAPASAQHERRAQSGGSAPDNDDVEHERLNCKSRAAEPQRR